MTEVDDGFYDRADEHIHLSNRQMSKVSIGEVSASMMYSVARFNAHVDALGWTTGEDMRNNRQKAVEYFVGQYKKMIEENLDDYIDNFDQYMEFDKRNEHV